MFGTGEDDAAAGAKGYDPYHLSSPQVSLIYMLIFLAIAAFVAPAPTSGSLEIWSNCVMCARSAPRWVRVRPIEVIDRSHLPTVAFSGPAAILLERR